MVSVTVEVDVADPCAAVFASRLASDRWFCWEQPDRGFALAGLGVAHESASRGAGRFADVAEECLRIGGDPVLEQPRGLPAGAGPVWLGGFAFDPDGGSSSTWSSLSPASLVLPELSLCRSGGRTFLTVNAVVNPGDDAERHAAAIAGAGSRDCSARRRCRCSTRTRPPMPRSAAPGRRASSKPPSPRPQTGSAPER